MPDPSPEGYDYDHDHHAVDLLLHRDLYCDRSPGVGTSLLVMFIFGLLATTTTAQSSPWYRYRSTVPVALLPSAGPLCWALLRCEVGSTRWECWALVMSFLFCLPARCIPPRQRPAPDLDLRPRAMLPYGQQPTAAPHHLILLQAR
jgi:hypothetical protein